MISVFGATGFIGSRFCELYPQTSAIPRESCYPVSINSQILYLISTTDNYNVLSLDVETNLLVLSKRLQKLNKRNIFNFISSWFIYHKDVELPAKEADCKIPPPGNYSLTKWLAERMVITYCLRENLPFRIFRLANVFGSGDKYSQHKNALQWLIGNMILDLPIELYYGGDFERDYIYVDDVCKVLWEGMHNLPPNRIYNIGTGYPTRFKDLILMAHELVGSKSKISSVDHPKFHDKVSMKDFYMDTSEINSYGITVEHSPFQTLARMLLDGR